ncbi:ABC transporter substrate-binding protein [Candidatus Nucleicultrix amoebiphila]|jgi:putative ABC transport system substrate-binding protein|uniref:ABC transporter substrate-binding protein n=1 Tax=Candidatus Nucleicultrix amoebiphila TaxID=1509244 RepID=UPI000A267F95|nr:ABC transporter substrate-binding protein [Candidatus Nucleicultrix amoebiphila]
MSYNFKPTKTVKIFISRIIPTFFLFFPFHLHSSENQKIVAITQIVSHPAADKTRFGVIDALKKAGYEEGKNLKILYENPEGNMATAVQIAQKFVGLKPDVIVPITTPSAQTIVSAARGSIIPVVFASITDPVFAKIVPSLKKPGGMITGASDFPPIEGDIALMKEIMPEIKRIGMINNPGEINAVKMMELTLEAAKKQGIEVVHVAAAQSKDVLDATRALVGKKVDAIFICLDNTALSAMDGILQIAFQAGIPVFSSDPDSVDQGVLACLSHTQYQTGYLAGEMIVRIFDGEKPGDISVSHPKVAELHLNQISADKLKIEFPKSLIKKAKRIIKNA